MEFDKMTLFQQQLDNKYNRDLVAKSVEAETTPDILKATKNATLEDFISMVAKICNKALSQYNVKFIPDEGAVLHDPIQTLEQPTILYSVISREPTHELKPRHSEVISEEVDTTTGKKRLGNTWIQRMNCLVQFNVIASDYETANKVMSIFEDTIFAYIGYFKNQGVAEIHFSKYYTDKNLDTYRQYLSVRSIQYFIEIEKLITIFDTTLEDIDI